MMWKKQIATLKSYKPGKSIDEVKQTYKQDRIVKLASNENPHGFSSNITEFLHSTKSNALYPDGYATVLRSKLMAKLNLKANELIFGNGSDEIIQIISRSLLGPNTSTIMATPTFPQYRHNAVIEGAKVIEVPLIEGEHDLLRMIDEIREDTSVIWLCSPNNPTGLYISNEMIHAFLKQVPNDILVVLDEAYFEYVVAEDYYNARALIEKYPNVIVLRTFSKIYGLASFRVGYGFGNEEIIKHLEPVREPFNTNTLAQGVASVALSDDDFIKGCIKENREGMAQFEAFCKINNLSFYPSQANFILIDFNQNADDVFQFLLERGFIVRSGQALGFPTSIRITIGCKADNADLLSIMEEWLLVTSNHQVMKNEG
jgi:histidinol-phosphate aminotransferase